MLKQLPSFPPRDCAPKAPLIKAPPLVAEYCGMRNLRIKDCSQTATGTMKDYRSVEIIRHLEGLADHALFFQITYGNAGYSLGFFCDRYNREAGDAKFAVLNIVDKNTDPAIKERLRRVSEVVEMDLSRGTISTEQMEGIAFASASFKKMPKEDRDRTYVIDVELFGMMFPKKGLYRQLVDEVAKEDAALVMMPIGSGELYMNFQSFHPFGEQLLKNPHLESRIRGACVPGNVLCPTSFPSLAADKLVVPSSRFRPVSAVMDFVDDASVMEAQAVLSQAGIKTEPSAATAFAALKALRLRDDDAPIIVVNTGCGLWPGIMRP